MPRFTQKLLIEQIKTLKEIKPRNAWVILLKSKILAEKTAEVVVSAQKASFSEVISNWTLRGASAIKFQISNSFSRRLAYSFAVMLFLVVGVWGAIKLLPTGKVVQQPAALTSQTQTAASIKDQINTTVKNLAQNLKDNPVQSPQTMKIIVKTLADMPVDVKANQEVKDLMQTVVGNQISDLQKTTLTDEQKNTLTQVEDLYSQGKYADALELLMASN